MLAGIELLTTQAKLAADKSNDAWTHVAVTEVCVALRVLAMAVTELMEDEIIYDASKN